MQSEPIYRKIEGLYLHMLEDSDLYLNFSHQFGKDQADAVYAAAISHRDGDHNGARQSFEPTYPDEFATAFAFAIGYRCVDIDSYREYHGITADLEQMRQWCIDNRVLERATDCNFICLMVGGYDTWAGESPDAMRVQPDQEYPL